jgi:hypothetical protein
MQESWVELVCPDCGRDWEETVADLPEPSEEFRCEGCDTEGRTAEFLRTARGLEILESFHA